VNRRPAKSLPSNLAQWIDARKHYHLSHAQIQMARELGMNPKKLGGLANHHQEPWKMPLPQFIETLYRKRFGRSRPENVLSIEDFAAHQATRKQQRKREHVGAERDPGRTEPPPSKECG
jgi:hypothetical protein